jgi:hypothetical protein
MAKKGAVLQMMIINRILFRVFVKIHWNEIGFFFEAT